MVVMCLRAALDIVDQVYRQLISVGADIETLVANKRKKAKMMAKQICLCVDFQYKIAAISQSKCR